MPRKATTLACSIGAYPTKALRSQGTSSIMAYSLKPVAASVLWHLQHGHRRRSRLRRQPAAFLRKTTPSLFWCTRQSSPSTTDAMQITCATFNRVHSELSFLTIWHKHRHGSRSNRSRQHCIPCAIPRPNIDRIAVSNALEMGQRFCHLYIESGISAISPSSPLFLQTATPPIELSCPWLLKMSSSGYWNHL